jgi:hypothetical protein
MARNKRKVYGEDDSGKAGESWPCVSCGCRHLDIYERDAVTGKVRKRICRNCGAIVVN